MTVVDCAIREDQLQKFVYACMKEMPDLDSRWVIRIYQDVNFSNGPRVCLLAGLSGITLEESVRELDIRLHGDDRIYDAVKLLLNRMREEQQRVKVAEVLAEG